MSAQSYISSIAAPAQRAVAGTGLYASVMIAQAAEESGFGRSPLASKYNNHFGIKPSGGWSGGTVKMDTTEYVHNQPIKIKADFRTYSSIDEGFADRVKFLQGNSRYKKAGVFAAPTPEAQAQALQSAGYATDPQYATKLIRIISEYGLKMYDSGQPGSITQNSGTAGSIAEKSGVDRIAQKIGAGIAEHKILFAVVTVLVAMVIFTAIEEL